VTALGSLDAHASAAGHLRVLPPADLEMPTSLGAYATLSGFLAVGVVSHAVFTRKQFYPAVIYLATSKFSILVSG